ncbi:MAG: excinuclease ABC subunit UvrC [Bacilli bacterium]
MNQNIENNILLLSTSPGCYLMYDINNVVIYVGKAKNLKNRVSQYFLQPHTGKVGAMVSHVDHFETIVTTNDNEAFVLELNLIHKYYPRYNVMLKDDKHYPYIALKKGNDPQVKLLRNTNNKNYFYFGPYPRSSYAREVVDLLNSIYPTRKCKTMGSKLCIYYQMGQCLGPCVKKIEDAKINEVSNEIKSFLAGKTYEITQRLKNEVKELNKNMEYEESQKIYRLLESIEHIKIVQSVDFHDEIDRDIFGYTVRDGFISITLFIYRCGMLLGKDNFMIEMFENEIESVANIIVQYYENKIVPEEIVLFNDDLANELRPLYGKKIKFVQNGKLSDVLPKLIDNSQKYLDEYFLSARLDDKVEITLDNIASLLKINTPYTIDLFDNSHISGDDAVGVAVVFKNGRPFKKMYRKYKLKNINTQDDLENMKEVINRRYSRMKEEGTKFPDLILLDGGENQISVAEDTLNSLEITLPIYGLYKNDKHQTEGIIDKNGQKFDLTEHKDIFLLLTAMQNEVHRFAITFHRKLHINNYKKTVLDGLPGLGESRKNAIFSVFKDFEQLKNATIDELKQIIPESVANALYERIHKNS